MNWGMMQGLGQAISQAGDIWGPGRLAEQRKIAEDTRREQELKSRLATDESQRALAGEQLAGAKQQRQYEGEKQGEWRATAPIRQGTAEANLKTLQTQLAQATFTLDEEKKRIAAQPPDYYQRIGKANLEAAEQKVKEINAAIEAHHAQAVSAGAAAAASNQSVAESKQRVQITGEVNQPAMVARRSVKEDIDDFRRNSDRWLAQQLNDIQLTYQNGLNLTGTDAGTRARQDAAFRAQQLDLASRQLKGWAQGIATDEINAYETIATSRGVAAWKNPVADKAGAIAQRTNELMGPIIQDYEKKLKELQDKTPKPPVTGAATPTGPNSASVALGGNK